MIFSEGFLATLTSFPFVSSSGSSIFHDFFTMYISRAVTFVFSFSSNPSSLFFYLVTQHLSHKESLFVIKRFSNSFPKLCGVLIIVLKIIS